MRLRPIPDPQSHLNPQTEGPTLKLQPNSKRQTLCVNRELIGTYEACLSRPPTYLKPKGCKSVTTDWAHSVRSSSSLITNHHWGDDLVQGINSEPENVLPNMLCWLSSTSNRLAAIWKRDFLTPPPVWGFMGTWGSGIGPFDSPLMASYYLPIELAPPAPDTMTHAAWEATTSSSGKKLYITGGLLNPALVWELWENLDQGRFPLTTHPWVPI